MTWNTKIIRSNGEQLVPLPAECGFPEDEVCIKRIGSALLIFPRKHAWRLFRDALGKADADFLPDRMQPRDAER